MITVITGLAGSGKSTLGRRLAKRYQCTLLDEAGIPGKKNWPKLRELVRSGKDVVLIEVAYITKQNREWFREVFADQAIHWMIFQNDARAANANCRRRKKRDPDGHVRLNRRFAKEYEPITSMRLGWETQSIQPVWSPEKRIAHGAKR